MSQMPLSSSIAVTPRRKTTSLERARRKLVVPFLLPALVLYIGLFILPSIGSVYISLQNWNGFTSNMKFIGLRNYFQLLHDHLYWISFFNTLKVLVLVGIAVFVLGFLFTSILSFIPGRKMVRAIIFFPNIIPPVALAILWGFLFDPQFGPIQTMGKVLHLGFLQHQWLGPNLMFTTISIGLGWMYTGFYTVIILAGAERIPAYYYEAAQLDGANRIRQFFSVTLPLTWDVISVALVLWVINAVKIFEFIYAFAGTGSNPPTQIFTSAIYMYILAFGSRTPIYALGYASAVAVSMVVLIAVLVLLLRRILFRERVEY